MSLLFPAALCGEDFLCPAQGYIQALFGLELFKKTSSFRLEFHVGGVLILYIGGFAAFADEGVHV